MTTDHITNRRRGRLARRITALVAAMLTGLTGLALGVAAAQAAVTDQPMHDPGYLAIKKVVEGSSTQFAGGITDLSGAKFELNWYKGVNYDSLDDLNGKKPDGTAVWTTDKDGFISIATGQPEGDDLGWIIKSPTGANALPLGTYTVVEKSVPAGTVPIGSNSPNYLYPMFRIVDSGDHVNSRIEQINTWKKTYPDIGSKDTDGTIVVPNHPKLTGVSVTKYDEETAASAPQGDATLEGVTYVITNQSDDPVYIREGAKGLITEGKQPAEKQLAGSTDKANFYTYAKGEAIMRITTVKETDTNGKAVYRAKTDDKVLPPGDYQIKEEHTPLGYANAGWTKDFTYKTTDPDGGPDGKPFEFSQSRDGDKDGDGGNYNKVWRGGLAVCKVDTDRQSGKPLTDVVKDEAECSNAPASVNQGDGDLTGVEYTITNTSEAAVVIPQSEESSAWVTNKANVATAKDGAKGWLVGPGQVIGVIRTQDLSGGKGDGPFIALLRGVLRSLSLRVLRDTPFQ
ncbi:prealbumin-like fold domain-containing protein [Bifidobacterium jacchi]|uniref:Prealbumin-like fold domain-containing protein n=1 Tax=Bifidobacterium jacchi TaxID=2490545 RepID=A0A5N5RD38_9BIFI|nr:prealbumin-like fold domain-containing protein [Bifidobacterium jacchi]KAB5604812.1 hypothetical protein EHS19_09665 [Bifidobacterium jacchi]